MTLSQTPVIEDPPPREELDFDSSVDESPRPRGLARRLRAPIATTLVLQVVMALCDRLPSVDGLAYFEAGRNLVGGRGYVRLDSPELHFPPVTPVGLAVLEKVLGSEMRALGVWNVACGMGVVIALVALAHRIWQDDSVTVSAAWFGGTMAGLTALFFRAGGGSEATTVAFLLLAAVLVIDGLRTPLTRPARRTLLLMGSASAVGLAYLSRPEALMPGAFVGLAVLGWWWRDGRANGFQLWRPLRDLAAFGLVVLLLVFPYVAYLHTHTGKWSPTAKTQDVSIDAWKAVAENNRLERDRILYHINKSGTGLQSDTKPLTTLAKENPEEWREILRINLGTMQHELFAPDWAFGPAWTLIPIIPLLCAFTEIWRRRRGGTTLMLGLMGLMPVVTCILFFTLPRYLGVTTAVLTLFGAAGFVRWARALAPTPRHVFVGATVVIMATSFLTMAGPYLPGLKTKDPVDQAETGRWLREHTPPGSRVMTRSFHVQAYADRPIVAMPYTDYPSMITFARRMGVSYIVADSTNLRTRRPELYPALMSDWQPPRLKLVKVLGTEDKPVRIYQLDPLPPPSDQGPIYLGYVSD